MKILNNIYYIIFILLFSLSYSVSNEGMQYSLSIDKKEIKNDDIIINLKADIFIDEGYYVQSSHPDLSLNPTIFEWEEFSVFKNLGQMGEPKPETKYDKSMKMNIGKHYDSNIQMTQQIIPKDNIQPGIYNLKGEFIYQVCDEMKCIPYYDEVNFEIKILDYNNYTGSMLQNVEVIYVSI